MICACDQPIPNPDDLTCVKCAKPSVAALQVDALDATLQYRRRIGYAEIDEPAEVTGDCSLPCFRHGGPLPCQCEEDAPGTTTAPGGW